MFNSLCEILYNKVLVTIVVARENTTVYVEVLNKQGIINVYEEVFETESLNNEMYEYITYFTDETPFFYVSVLDNSISQGAIPTCSKQETSYFYDLSASEHKCFNDKWTYYTEKSDIYEIEKKYKKIGLDFIFSPFVVLAHFFKDKVDGHLAMFILVEEAAISLTVFQNSELLYGKYLEINLDETEELLMDDENIIDEIDLDEEDEPMDLDDINTIDDIDELDDFGDIADLDSIEEIDEFSESKDVEEELAEREHEEEFPLEESDELNEDYQRFIHIQSSVNNFYKNEKYTSEFVENVYIADSIGLSLDLKRYLEEEMFLNVYIRRIDLAHVVCDLTKAELVWNIATFAQERNQF